MHFTRPLRASLLAIGGAGLLISAGLAAAQEENRAQGDAPAIEVEAANGPNITAPVEIETNERSGPHPDLAQDYDPNPALWLLSDVDTKIYMFGTYHALPPDFAWRTPALDRLVKSVDELVLESTNADMYSVKRMRRMTDTITARTGAAKRSIRAQLSPENREKWDTLASKTHLPIGEFDVLPPLSIVFLIESQISSFDTFRGDLGVENVLTRDFRRMDKPIGAIEDGIQVMANLMGIDEALWIASLDADLAAWDGEDLDTFFSTGAHWNDRYPNRDPALTGIAADNEYYSVHMWAKGLGDVDDMAFGNGELGREFRRVLLEDRNRAWAAWLDDRLDRPGTILLAVGSAHFGGHDSVLEMLKERGLTAKRIN